MPRGGGDPASMSQFLGTLRERFPKGTIGLVSQIEQSKGALGKPAVGLPVYRADGGHRNPHAPAKFRRSLHWPSGSKSDRIDSSALLRMLFTHRDRLSILRRSDDRAGAHALSRHRRNLVNQRVQVSNRLKSLLREYYPQALPMLAANSWDPLSLAFLRRWPSYSRLMRAKRPTLEKFYYASGQPQQGGHRKAADQSPGQRRFELLELLEELGQMQLRHLEQLSLLNNPDRRAGQTAREGLL